MPTVQSADASGPQTERAQNAAAGSLREGKATNAGAEQESAKANAAESGREENAEENGDE